MFSSFEGKPDHLLFDLAAARWLISELSVEDCYKALEDVTFRLDSINATSSGYKPRQVRLEANRKGG